MEPSPPSQQDDHNHGISLIDHDWNGRMNQDNHHHEVEERLDATNVRRDDDDDENDEERKEESDFDYDEDQYYYNDFPEEFESEVSSSSGDEDNDSDDDTVYDEDDGSVNDEAEDEEATVVEDREQFSKLLMRLARNDPTLIELDDWSDYGIDPSSSALYWTDFEMFLLGHSLTGNTHLKKLHLEIASCFGHTERGAKVLAQGIAQSQIQQLRMTNVCYPLLQTLLKEGVGYLTSFQKLKFHDVKLNVEELLELLLTSRRTVPMAATTTDDATSPSNATDINVATDHDTPGALLLQHACTTTNDAATPEKALTYTVIELDTAPLLLAVRSTQLPVFHYLTNLTLSQCSVQDEDMMALSIGISHIPTLEMLNLAYNEITNVGIRLFCDNWWMESALQIIDVRCNRISDLGACTLMRATMHHAAMQRLVLNGNQRIGYKGLRTIGQKLLPTSTLLYLELHNVVGKHEKKSKRHHKRDAACQALAYGVRHNNTLQELAVGNNALGVLGVQMLCQAIAIHPTLNEWSMLADQSIGFDGIKHIGQELPNLQHLTYLSLEWCARWPRRCSSADVGTGSSHGSANVAKAKLVAAAHDAGRALLEGVKRHHRLQRLDFRGLDDEWMKPIQFFLDLNQTCRPLLLLGGALWPLAFGKLSNSQKFSQLYFALQEQPWLVPNHHAGAAAMTSNKGK